MSKKAIDALMELGKTRDTELCTAYELCNQRKAGYSKRVNSSFFNATIADNLFSSYGNDASTTESLQNCIKNSYKSYIPYFIDTWGEWVLIIIFDCTVHFIYARYAEGITSPSNKNERAAYNILMTDKLTELMAGVLPNGNTYLFVYQKYSNIQIQFLFLVCL